MSAHILKRIAGVIETKFTGRIHMKDWEGKPSAEAHRAFLSRGLAALAVNRLAAASIDEASMSVTDGGDDGALDAIYYDQTTETIFFVQSKWSGDGSKTVDLGSATKFVDGISKIVNDDLSGFNGKVKSAMIRIRPVLFSGIDVKFKLILIHVGEQDVSFHVKQKVLDYVSNLNTPVKIAEEEFYNQSETYKLIISEHSTRSIALTISLRQFGFLPKPYLSYYGRVNVKDIAAWWRDHGNNIFSRNLRQLIRRSDINDALYSTINNSPDNFWYLNNGITVICKSAKRAAVNADNTDFGIFHCEGVSVVNGAQTVGVIGEALSLQDPENIDIQNRFRDSWAHVRIIPLDGCPSEFDRRITEATNFQNAVDRRDFAAMDAVQHRLATEFMLDRKKYAYLSGEERPNDEEGCTIVEATQSLACAHSMDLAVQAKREIGLLLSDTTKPPYTDLFNERTNSIHLWKMVSIMRAVESSLVKIRMSDDVDKKAEVIATHLNRTITNLVFSDQTLKAWKSDSVSVAELIELAKIATPKLFAKVSLYIKQNHDEDYLASLAKNRDKCTALKDAVLNSGKQGDLFGGQQ